MPVPDSQGKPPEKIPEAVPPLRGIPDAKIADSSVEIRKRLERSITLSTEDELDEARESGEVSQTECDPNYLSRFATESTPLAREDVGNDAVVIHRDDFEGHFGNLRVITPSGDEAVIVVEDIRDEYLIILPKHLGNRPRTTT